MLNQKWILVTTKTEIPVLGARVVSGSPAGPIAIFKTLDDTVFALLDHCPHQGGPLSQGIVHGNSVTCPMHAWNIGLEDGCAVLPDVGCARSFAVKCVGDDIYLQQDQLAEP